jgi:hypothetical protein
MKNTNNSKQRVTQTNLFVLRQITAANSCMVPAQIEARYYDHIRRCRNAGLLDSGASDGFSRLTPAGRAALGLDK